MLLNFNGFSEWLADIDLNTVRIFNTINLRSYCISKKDKAFETALQSSDVLLPNGSGNIFASKVLNG